MKNHSSLGEGVMELPQVVISEAKSLVEAGASLPALIPSSAGFYVAKEDDTSVLAFNGFEANGAVYKIGTKK